MTTSPIPPTPATPPTPPPSPAPAPAARSPQPASVAMRMTQRVSTMRQPDLGLIDPEYIRIAFVYLIDVLACLLILLSVVGTFYGLRNMDAPLTMPIMILFDIIDAPSVALVALLAQSVLSLSQWGARQFAAHDQRWWGLYVASLALSTWWNWAAYGDPLIALGVPWLLAAGIIVLGDVFPELILVRDRE